MEVEVSYKLKKLPCWRTSLYTPQGTRSLADDVRAVAHAGRSTALCGGVSINVGRDRAGVPPGRPIQREGSTV